MNSCSAGKPARGRMPRIASASAVFGAAMCGRFVRLQKPNVYATLFEADSVPAGPSYNVAPTQPVAAVRLTDGRREWVLLRWGLIPFWSKDGKKNYINAR